MFDQLKRSVLIVICFLFSFSYGEVIRWNKTDTVIPITPYIQYAKTSKVTPNLEEVQHLNFIPSDGKIPNYGFYQGGAWYKFSILNSSVDDKIYLELGNAILDKCFLYHLDGETYDLLDKTGDFFSYANREIKQRTPIFSIQPKQNEVTTYLLFVANHGEQFYLPINLYSSTSLNSNSDKQHALFGVYFGILVFVFFFNLFIAIVLKEHNNYWYLLYILFLGLLQFSLNGFGLRLIWGENSWFSARSNLIFASLSVFMLIHFCLNFLKGAYQSKLFDKVVRWGSGIVLINLLLSFFIDSTSLRIPIIIINAFTFVFGLSFIYMAYLALKNNFKPARYFLLAFIVLILSVFIFILRNGGIIPNYPYADYGLQIGSSLEVILLTFAIIDKFKSYKEESINRLQEIFKIKERANKELEHKVKERTLDLTNANTQLKSSNELIIEKNKEITDSINYAQKIQQAIIPSDSKVKNITPGSFVYFSPKDIVSGDFYWVYNTQEYSIFTVADCTGHGVPGGFMSMIGNSLLNQIVKEKNIIKPADILTDLRSEVISTMSEKNDSAPPKDGMDIVLCKLSHEKSILEFSGGNNPLYLIRQNNLLLVNGVEIEPKEQIGEYFLFQIDGDSQPIGFQYNMKESFTNYEINYVQGDQLFLFTDGYPDQFGGEKGKKMKYKRFRKILIDNYGKSPDIQRNNIQSYFSEWLGDHEQVDDVCVMGVFISS